MKYYTMFDIKLESAQAGQHFFDKDTMRFFNSHVSQNVYQGPGGIYFITSERYDYSGRYYTVREFNEGTKHVSSVFNELSRYEAHKIAQELSATKTEVK